MTTNKLPKLIIKSIN